MHAFGRCYGWHRLHVREGKHGRWRHGVIILGVHTLHVFCECGASTKFFATPQHLTFVGPLARVCTPMARERTCIGKCLQALAAYERALARVHVDVHR